MFLLHFVFQRATDVFTRATPSSIASASSSHLPSLVSDLWSRLLTYTGPGRCLHLSVSPLVVLRTFTIQGPMLIGSVISGPVFPSLFSYIVGLVFYAYHFPECIIPPNIQRRLDAIGGGTSDSCHPANLLSSLTAFAFFPVGSHAIWHCFIVLAVSQHKAAIGSMKGGMQCLL